jgi:1-acyl-sn-glycerol-3-phosphate acyltransferase
MIETPARGESTTSGDAGDAPGKPPRRNRALEIGHRLDNEKSMYVRMVALICRIVSRAFANIEVQGLERIPRTGPVILAANHISNLDAVVAGSWITTALRRRRIHWLGKRELFDWPVFGVIAALGGVHPVDRGTADVEAFRLATRILESGYVLFAFPEGTRSPTGELQAAKEGIAMLAIRTGSKVVPIGINNSDAVWPKGRKLPMPFPRRTITVRIGEPFSVADTIPPGTERRAQKGIAIQAIMVRVAALLDPRHRGVYADTIRPAASPEQ